MRITLSKTIFAFATLLALGGQLAQAESAKTLRPSSDRQCADLVKECFAYSDSERSDCFHSAGTHSFCAGSALGDLAMKRWSMSSNQNPTLDQAPALLGPKVVDGDCVSNFDNKWSGALVQGAISADATTQLTQTLNACNRSELPSDLMRP
ncbi:MAG: hypothetical protein J0M12_14215 [Deltaproteobacteria bacterium]|nr:hypothetical protein [Deltaproteobacteria bacterium]